VVASTPTERNALNGYNSLSVFDQALGLARSEPAADGYDELSTAAAKRKFGNDVFIAAGRSGKNPVLSFFAAVLNPDPTPSNLLISPWGSILRRMEKRESPRGLSIVSSPRNHLPARRTLRSLHPELHPTGRMTVPRGAFFGDRGSSKTAHLGRIR